MQLSENIYNLFSSYNAQHQLEAMKQWGEHHITETQFAQVLGRCRLYNHLPKSSKVQIPELLISDSQVGQVARGYFEDDNFKGQDGLSLWQLHNLFTGANKSSYIDRFLDRGVNASNLITHLQNGLNGDNCWYLD